MTNNPKSRKAAKPKAPKAPKLPRAKRGCQISPDKLATSEEISALINRVEKLIISGLFKRTSIPGYNRIHRLQDFTDTVDIKKSTLESIHRWIDAELDKLGEIVAEETGKR